MSFGIKLKQTREAQGLTLCELAKISGVHLQQLKLYEDEKVEPRLYTVVDLADALNVSIDYLCERGHRIEVWCY